MNPLGSCRLGRAEFSNTVPVTGYRSKFRMMLGGNSRVAKPNAFENSGNQNDYQTKTPSHLPNNTVVFHFSTCHRNDLIPRLPERFKSVGFRYTVTSTKQIHLPNAILSRSAVSQYRSTQPTKTVILSERQFL